MCMSNHTFDGSIGLLGFGEVGQRFAADLHAREPRRGLATFDLLLHQAADGEAMRRHAAANSVEILTHAAGLVGPQALVFSAVTADQTLAAARSLCAAGALDGAWIIDLNSAAPQVKTECAALVAAAGGRYVEAAVMGAVAPHGIRVPMLLGGENAAAAEQLLRSLGFVAEAVSADLGVASAIKLCRSVVIKGLEALVVESFTAARHFGVERQVLASLAATFPQIDWEKQGDYQFSRVIQHGRRRAEEMRASAQMIDEAGIGGLMAAAAASRQQAVAELRATGGFAGPDEVRPWRERADEIVAKRPTEAIRPAGKRVGV
jgi:3-hydroxyisobutyrate dehydrogenase-like beta-hydroxyacid dehydrogenase